MVKSYCIFCIVAHLRILWIKSVWDILGFAYTYLYLGLHLYLIVILFGIINSLNSIIGRIIVIILLFI